MPLDHPNKHEVVPKSRMVEVIERTQEDAMRKLRQAGVPEAHVLHVIQRISVLCLQTLRELDRLYQQFEEIVMEAGRSEANQEWLNNKAVALLLQTESAIATLVAEAIDQAIRDYKTKPPPAEPVIEVQRAQPAPPARWPGLLRHLVWAAGMVASLVFSHQGSGSIVWAGIGLLIPFLIWVRFGSAWWALIFPVIALGLEAWVLYWLYVVEGYLR
jgi:hypothetical protein